jgi:hypothetical protein
VRYNEHGRISVKLRRYVLGCYAIWVVFLIALYYGVSGLRLVTWGLISLSGVVAIVAGTFLNHPARKTPWLVLAAAQASFAAGQLSFLIAARLKIVLPFPSFADALYLLTFPLYAVGLLIFIYWRSPDKDRRSLIDALTLTAGLALLSWTFLIRPYVHNPGLSDLQKAVAIAYPLGDVLTLALLARLLAPGSGRTRCVQLLALGCVGCLVSDVAFDWVQLHGTFHNGTIIDLGWALFYTAWGASALHPTMAKLTEPVPRQQEEVSGGRLALLMLASLIAPVVLITAVPGGTTPDVSVVAVFSAVLYLLVLARLWEAAAAHRRALNRERVLREAGLSLVTAADLPAVATTVKFAVSARLGAQSQGEALLEVRIDGKLRAAAPGSPGDAADRQAGQAGRELAAVGDRDHPDPDRDSPATRAGPPWPARRRVDAALPGHGQGQAHRRSAHRPDRGIRAGENPHRPVRDAGNPRPPSGPHGGEHHASPGGDPAAQRGLLPHPGPGRLRRHHDRR